MAVDGVEVYYRDRARGQVMADHVHATVEGAGHMSPVSHADLVNPIVERHIVRRTPD